ncbi:MAG: histidinol-phosphate aminotransferase [Candidatus Poribacteria bacterium]|nr:MAG: histidinol-phosphate aminotransferase [Candidatus Poribacteria bacterium]
MTRKFGPKPGIEQIRPYQGGKPIEEVQRELGLQDVIKLASNENPLGPSPRALEAIRSAAKQVHLYPDGNAYYLKQALAEHLDVDPSQILLGNGSNEVLQMLGEALLLPGDHLAYSDQAFVVYDLIRAIFGAKATKPPLREYTYDLEALAEAVRPETKIVFIANPNNPTGTYVRRNELERFLDRIPETTLVVLDEAYFEYVTAPDYPNGLEYVRQGRNVLVTRTFSKIYGLAGLRVGYGIGRPELISWLNRVRQPFNVNALGQAAARAALEDQGHLEKGRRINQVGMAYLEEALRSLGLEVVPSVANFLLVHLKRSGARVAEALLRRGVIVRPMGGYRFPDSIRVTIGLPEENERFVAALREVLEEVEQTAP